MGRIRLAESPRVLRALFLVNLCIATSTFASDKSSQLIDAGLAHLQQGRAEQALQSFEQAAREDPTDSEAVFFSAVALNHLGRADEALARIAAARKLGSTHPDIPFQTGWSYLMLKRWQEAIDQLDLFEKQTPGRGQTAEFLGRAHLALGHHKEADAYFNEALKRDPDLLPTVSMYRALLRQRQGYESAARDEISIILRAPDSVLRGVVGSALMPLPQQGYDRPWSLSLRTAIGYNTDARGFSNLVPENSGDPTPAQSSAFARIGLDAAYAIINHPSDRLSIGYDLLADFYARQETDPDLLDQYAYLEYWHLLGDRFSTTLRLWENHTFVGEDQFRNELAGQAALGWKIFPTFAAEASYRYAFDDYLYDTTRIVGTPTPDPSVARNLNRDAQMHTLSIAAELALPKQNARLRAGYFHTWNFAKRDDFDYHSDGLFAGLTVSLPWKIVGEAFYVHTFDRYEDPNSLTILTFAGAPPAYPRKDDVDGLTLRLTRPLSPHISIYIEFNFNHDNSNVPGYDYEQHLTSGGLIWQF